MQIKKRGSGKLRVSEIGRLHYLVSAEEKRNHLVVNFNANTITWGDIMRVSMSARNYHSNKHNEVVNKHRQNALLTYEVIAHAIKDSDKRDTVLQHAASCIIAPQASGYSTPISGVGPEAKSIVELVTSARGEQ